MIRALSVVLVKNATEFFEDAELLIGVPLVALGALGALIVLALIAKPEPGEVLDPRAVQAAGWAVSVAIALAMIVAGAVFHVSLIIGGVVLGAIALVRLVQIGSDQRR